MAHAAVEAAEAIARAEEAQKIASLQEKPDPLIAVLTVIPSPRDWLIVSQGESRFDKFPPHFINYILRSVGLYFKLPVAVIKGPRRNLEFVRPRQIVFYFAKLYTNLSFPQMGHKLGNRDHTTAIHSVNRIKELQFTDICIKEAVDKLDIIFKAKVAEWRAATSP